MKLKATFFALLVSAVFSSAATVQLARSGAGTGFAVQTSTNVTLSAGGYFIAVGNFGASPIPTITTPAELLTAVNAFQIFGSTLSPTTGTTQGLIVGSITATNTAFNSTELMVLVGNAATKELSTEFAILRGTPQFTFAANLGVAVSNTYTLAQTTQIDPIPGAGTETDSGTGVSDIITLAPTTVIPEPSTAALGLLAGLGLMIRRRRA
jgi:hypothetical protein